MKEDAAPQPVLPIQNLKSKIERFFATKWRAPPLTPQPVSKNQIWRSLMKRFFGLMMVFAVIAVLQFAHATTAYFDNSGFAQSKDFKKSVAVDNGADFHLETDKGSVKLTAWDGNQVEIVARIDPPENESDDYQRRAVEGARIEVLGGGHSLTVRSNFDGVPYKDTVLGGLNQSKNLPNIHYEIRAPRNLNVSVQIDRSRLEVQGFKGRMSLESDRSPVTARDIEGDFRLNIDRGKAELTNLRGSFEIDADRTDGQIQSANLNNDSKIEIDRGEIDVHLSEAQGLNVKTDFSKRTHFNSDFAIATTSPNKTNFEGAINGGGPRLLIVSDRGTINLKRQ
jgi:hypothetical protein